MCSKTLNLEQFSWNCQLKESHITFRLFVFDHFVEDWEWKTPLKKYILINCLNKERQYLVVTFEIKNKKIFFSNFVPMLS